VELDDHPHPVLLLSAVFSQTSILNLYLPPPTAAPAPDQAAHDRVAKLVVSILRDGYVLSDGPQVIAPFRSMSAASTTHAN
jgi:hypothetical protein